MCGSVADLQAALHATLESSPWTHRTGEPAEEWIILDHEGFAGEGPDPHEALTRVVALAEGPSDNEGIQW